MSNGTKVGLVGFFDILGYQNLLERNEPEQIADEVLPILLGIKQRVRDYFREVIGPTSSTLEAVEAIIETMGWVSFSDSILITLPVDESIVAANRSTLWLTFLIAARRIQNELFKTGLPARGAIDYGKFFIKNTCFAGRTIVNAYQLCGQIEMAACVLSKNASKELDLIKQENGKRDLFHKSIIEYLVPLKEGEEHMLVVKSIPSDINESNLHLSVMRAFWGNGKDIPQKARSKIINTEQWLAFLLSKKSEVKTE